MKTKTIQTRCGIMAAIVLGALIFFPSVKRVQADAPVTAVYHPVAYPGILPSLTDDGKHCDDPAPNDAIGCDTQWSDDLAVNTEHYLYYPQGLETEGKLLLFLCGGHGKAEFCQNIFPAAAARGYHVIGLTYPANLEPCTPKFGCFGNFMWENITGEEHSASSHISEHPQDSIVQRLIAVLQWASDQGHNPPGHPGDLGWSRYLTGTPGHITVDWTKVNLAGFSNGSSHASRMGMLYPAVGRVALFSGPNDGRDEDETGVWNPANYIRRVPGLTDERYYGLVHFRNKAPDYDTDLLYRVTDNWTVFGMGDPPDLATTYFDPTPNESPYFGDSHILISTDPRPSGFLWGTSYQEAHSTVVKNRYCSAYKEDENECKNEAWDGPFVGYDAAWRCVLGAGHATASGRPVADAGPSQTVECQGNGGANVTLDGSGTRDYDCEFLKYEWTGVFDSATGRQPTVFFPLGISTAFLVVKDDWWSSLLPSATVVNVVDTQAPSLSVTLTPTTLWSPDHQLVRIDATIIAGDSCAAPNVVLTSVASDQPDNGVADGDTINDVQGVEADTFDRSFYVRAERAANDPNGRTYTVVYTATDSSGNQTQATATVHVPHG